MRILGLLSLALLGVTTGSPLGIFNLPIVFGLCRNPEVHPGFNVDGFFRDKWYSWKNKGNFFLGSFPSCSATQSRVEGETIKILHYQYEQILSQYVSIEGEADKEFVAFEGLRFPIDYTIYNDFKISIPLEIVGTDYDNWAVAYFCRQMFLTKIEMSWIMLREANITPNVTQLSQINKALSTIDLKIENFFSQDNSICGHSEPQL